MTGVTIQKIDEALVAHYSGIVVDGVEIPVLIEYPDNAIVPERIMPSVSLQFLSMQTAIELLEGDEEQEEVSFDDADPTKPIRGMRDVPIPHVLTYSVDTWNWGNRSTAQSRGLLMAVVLGRTPPHGSLRVQDVAGDWSTAWMMRTAPASSIPEVGGGSTTQHISTTIDIVAFLDVMASVQYVKAVAEVDVGVSGYGYPYQDLSPPPPPAYRSNDGLDCRFVITDDGVEVV